MDSATEGVDDVLPAVNEGQALALPSSQRVSADRAGDDDMGERSQGRPDMMQGTGIWILCRA